MIDLAALGDVVAEADRVPLERAVAMLRPFLLDIGWFHDLLAQGCAAMAADPMHLPEVRASRSGSARHLVIARTRRIWLTATVIDAASDRSDRVHFSGRHILCRPLNKALSGDVFSLRDEQAILDGERRIEAGELLEMDERDAAFRLHPAATPLMILRAQIAAEGPVTSRIHDARSGSPIAVGQADEQHNRRLMLLSLLRLQNRTDAASYFEQALDTLLSTQRWAIMREYLALDTQSALPRLHAMSRAEPDHRVRALAYAMLDRLESAPCPA